MRELKGTSPRNEQQRRIAAVQAWQHITREDTQHLVMSMVLRHLFFWNLKCCLRLFNISSGIGTAAIQYSENAPLGSLLITSVLTR